MAAAPLHRKIFTSIQKKIYSGEWSEGALMPTEAELCALFSVSRITVRRALDELVRLGLVEKFQGRGTFVRKSQLKSGDTNKGFFDAMRERGASVTTRLLHQGREAVGKGIAEVLQIEPDPSGVYTAWHFRRLRIADGLPVAIMNTYVRTELGQKMLRHDLEKESFYSLYASILGAPIATTEGSVTAITPDKDACRLLEVPEGSAHLWYRSVGRLMDGSPVETCFSIFNANTYEFVVATFRPLS
jgi:GntR family transcriptional regulator